MIHLLQAALALVFPGLVITAALRDVTSYTIPNWISLALLAAFPPAALALGLPLVGLGLHAAVGVGALGLGMVMFALGWIGGGDAKLAAATAAWLGWTTIFDYGLAAALFGGVLTLILLGARMFPLPAVLGRMDWLVRLHNANAGVPYGIALAAAGLMQYPNSSIWAAVT